MQEKSFGSTHKTHSAMQKAQELKPQAMGYAQHVELYRQIITLPLLSWKAYKKQKRYSWLVRMYSSIWDVS